MQKVDFYLLRFFVFMVMVMVVPKITHANNTVVVDELQCEHLYNPLGVDAPHPRLSWKLKDARAGALQTAYHIIVATDSANVGNEKYLQWNSGIIKSSSNLVTYSGKPLKAFTKYYWRIIVYDKEYKKSISDIMSFETGMMVPGNWQGSWISDSFNMNTKPAPYFRVKFDSKKTIKSARAYIAVAGLYELYINGNKIGDHRLDPVYTRFDRRTIYVTHDVTQQVITGNNAIGVLLGNGWYNHQSTAVWNFDKAPWRNRPAFCMDLRITYTDGSIEIISSGKYWKTSLSPIVFNSIYTAEHYDARLEQKGWNNATFDDAKWQEVQYRVAPSANIISQQLYPIRAVESVLPKSINKLNDTTYVFDLGRNISGISQLKIMGERGTIIKLKHAERLYTTGHVDVSNIDMHYRPTNDKDPFQTDIFILNGQGEETFEPKFNYKGFQFVELTSSKPIYVTKDNLVAFFMHTDVPAIGKINTSNNTINKIWQATNNSYLSNLFGYPTDCPQREKNGWTGDGQIAVETGLYNFDGITVYEKWMADHRDEQQPNGVLPAIIPTAGWGYEWANGPDWTSSIAIIPWEVYLFYGDKKILSDCYENIKRYVDHITSISHNALTDWGLGDWVPVKSKSSVEFTSSAYYYTDVVILAKAAQIVGNDSDYKKYEILANKIKTAINEKYFDKQKCIYASGTQTELSVALFRDLVPSEYKQKVAANLAVRVEKDSFHLDVGLLGSKAILNALSENGYADIAFKIASQESFPSWGWWIVNGATTLYENWPIDAKSDISLNHIMFGEIGAWFYKALGGIKPDLAHPGFKNILIEPYFVQGLHHFETAYNGPHGNIISSWKRDGLKIWYNLVVPANSTATICLPFTANTKVLLNEKLLDINSKIKASPEAGNRKYYQAEAGNYVFAFDNN